MNCPRCKGTKFGRKDGKRSHSLICAKCGRDVIDEDANEALGVKKVLYEWNGEQMSSYEGIGENWKMFPSWYCLKFFDTYEERIAHDKEYHKMGDKMLGMIPSGNIVGWASCDTFLTKIKIGLKMIRSKIL